MADLKIPRKRQRTYNTTWAAWKSMRQRCYNPNIQHFADYGGRGITVCDRWRHSYQNFLADMGHRPVAMMLDRIDNNGPYSPENCRWASRKEQNNNNRPNRFLTLHGETHTMGEWAALTGMSWYTIRERLRLGWSDERTLTTPVSNTRCFLTLGDETHLLVEWAELTGIHKGILRDRLRRGWTVERTLTAPVKQPKT